MNVFYKSLLPRSLHKCKCKKSTFWYNTIQDALPCFDYCVLKIKYFWKDGLNVFVSVFPVFEVKG